MSAEAALAAASAETRASEVKDLTELAKDLKGLGISHAELLQHLEELEKEGLVMHLMDEVTGRGVWIATANLPTAEAQ